MLLHIAPKDGKSWTSEGRSDAGKGSSSGISYVFVDVVDIWTHRGDHVSQPGCLAETEKDFSPLHESIVVLINQQRFNYDENLVDVGPHEIIELVENAIDDFDQQVAFLILQGLFHEKGQGFD